MRVSDGIKGYVLENEPGGIRNGFLKGSAGDCKDKRERLRLNDTVSLLHGSWFEALCDHKDIKFAGIISNPPYIPAEVAANLQPEVGRHEPMSALDGRGEMGMGDLDVICELSHKYLAPGGFLALETHGGEQALRVWRNYGTRIYTRTFARVEDYAGVDRFVTARLIDTKKVDTFSSNSSSNNNSSDD